MVRPTPLPRIHAAVASFATLAGLATAPAAATAAAVAPAPPMLGAGVALPGEWWRESIPMKSVGFLRSSVAGIDEQVKELDLIRKDVALMQEDLKSQEQVWHQAEEQLRRENAQLKAQVMQLRQQKESGLGFAGKVAALREQLEEVRKENATLTYEFKVEEQRAQLRRQAYEQRAAQLDEYLGKLEAAAMVEEAQVHQQQLALQASTGKLMQEESQLENKLKDLQKELQSQQVELEAKTEDLKEEVNVTKEERDRVLDQVVPKQQLEKELLDFQARLKHQTSELIKMKEEQVQTSVDCKRQTQQLKSVLDVEQAKANHRHQIMLKICTHAHTERKALEQALQTCEQK